MTFNALATFLSGMLAEQFSITSTLVSSGIIIFVLVIMLTISTRFFAFESVGKSDAISIGSLLDRQYKQWGT